VALKFLPEPFARDPIAWFVLLARLKSSLHSIIWIIGSTYGLEDFRTPDRRISGPAKSV